MNTNRRSYRWIWALILVAIVLFAGWRIFFKPAPQPPVSIAEIRSREGIPVTVLSVDLSPWEHWITLYGKTAAASEVKIAAEQQEYIDSVAADVGDTVAKGQILATLDRKTARERLSAQEAITLEMERRYDRLKILHAAGGASSQEMESALSNAKTARAGLKDLQTSFYRLTITSPVAGVVTGRFTEKGNLALPGQTLFVVADLGVLDVNLDVAPNQISRISRGMPSRVRTPNGWVDTVIKRIDPVADPATGLFNVVLSIPPNSGLSPGQTLEARIRDEDIADALLVPYQAVRQIGGDRSVVYVLSGDMALERDIIPGETYNGNVRVLSGLTQGETIILKGSDRLFPNARVWIQEE
ncbi:MAG: efflux RND transporter periplasmic adaptor subunit [Thermovirgaceae bacterium]|nr:efflux RND transporter periplasmic adaptor subunit [Thermovirgaceae bacterium]